jgi:hypothetical protein
LFTTCTDYSVHGYSPVFVSKGRKLYVETGLIASLNQVNLPQIFVNWMVFYYQETFFTYYWLKAGLAVMGRYVVPIDEYLAYFTQLRAPCLYICLTCRCGLHRIRVPFSMVFPSVYSCLKSKSKNLLSTQNSK